MRLNVSRPVNFFSSWRNAAAPNSSEVIGLAILFVRATYLRILKIENVRQLVRSKNIRNHKSENENVKEKKKIIPSKTTEITELWMSSSEGLFPRKC
jgi:hypothetical protein